MRLLGAILAQIAIALVVATSANAQTATTDTNPVPASPPASSPGDAAPVSPDSGAPAHPLLDPDESEADGPVHLHMPVPVPAAPKHVVRHKKSTAVAKVGASPDVAAKLPPAPPAPAALAPAAPATPQKAAKRTTVAPNMGGTTTSSENPGLADAVPFSFVANPNDAPPTLAPPPAPARAPAPQPHVAKASPPPAQSLPAEENVELKHGLERQSQILFAPGAPDPSTDALDAIRGLAGPLNTALAAGASRIQVVAYGGNRGDHSSDARRLSLKRALNIRKLLIDGGVPANRIDVRAMGGATDSAAADRVDVFTKA